MTEDKKEPENKEIEIEPKVPPVETFSEMEEEIAKLAAENGWEVNEVSLDTIVSAKTLKFGLDQWHPCPCDSENPQRFCGSELCADDIEKDGICHCGLFRKPE